MPRSHVSGGVDQVVDLRNLLFGPSVDPRGVTNLFGSLRRAMAKTGYSDLKEFQRVEVVVSPYQPR